jgi:hypothetical protein
MKAQCERCREIVELGFSLAAGGIDVTCPACKQAYFVAASTATAAPVVPVAPVAEPGGTPCPKCGHRQSGGESCKKCGLVFARWTPAAAAAASVDAEAERLWAQVLEAWDQPARHDAVLAAVQRGGHFAWLAARYRQAKDERGAADAMTARGLERLEKVVVTTLVMSGSKRETAATVPYRNTIIVMGLLLLMIAGGLVWGLSRKNAGRAEDDGAPLKPIVPHRVQRAPAQ